MEKYTASIIEVDTAPMLSKPSFFITEYLYADMHTKNMAIMLRLLQYLQALQNDFKK